MSTDYLLTGNDTLKLDVRGAIRADAALTSQAKKYLLGLIEELRGSD